VLIIVLTPIFLPLMTKYGIDPVHFGLIFIIAATIGNYTPPVGGAMFVVCQVLRCSIGDYAVSIVTPGLGPMQNLARAAYEVEMRAQALV
jgi:TRAP-type C4-dicarboxylate transport system permease large subunit